MGDLVYTPYMNVHLPFPVTPTTTKALLEAGFKVNVERSPERIFEDDEFAAVGATLVPEGSWPSAPNDHIIIGLKELPEETCTQPNSLILIPHPSLPLYRRAVRLRSHKN